MTPERGLGTIQPGPWRGAGPSDNPKVIGVLGPVRDGPHGSGCHAWLASPEGSDPGTPRASCKPQSQCWALRPLFSSSSSSSVLGDCASHATDSL